MMLRPAALLLLALAMCPRSLMAQGSAGATLVLDRYMSPAAGTGDLLAAQRALASLEDRFLPLKFGDERRRLPLLGGIGYRAGKLILLDIPQDHMLIVLGHEVFGHGARLRELGVGHISYSFDGPVPYAHGGAVTSFNGQVPDTPLTFLTIEMAGLEAQGVMADTIAEHALSRGRLHYREAWSYFESRYLALTYVLDATVHSPDGHDVADFSRTFADACREPACSPISLDAIKRGAKLTLADPMLYYALYGFVSSYIAMGQTTSRMPLIPLGPWGHGVRALPSLGFQITPYGTDHIFRSAFVSGSKDRVANVMTLAVRVGNTGASRPWGIDAHAADVRVFRKLHVRASLDVWRQPPPLADQTSAPLKMGGAAAATAALSLHRFTHADWLRATVTAGYKSEGFLPGELLGRGPILRIGVEIR